MATTTEPQSAQPGEAAASRRPRSRPRPAAPGAACGRCSASPSARCVFLFPFYYMVIGALQREPNSGVSGAFPNPANLTLDNLRDINQAINLPRTLLNSGIFTGGVLLCTLVLGLLAGYALARLEFRGQGHGVQRHAADPDRALPAADDPAVRDDRPRLPARATPTWA